MSLALTSLHFYFLPALAPPRPDVSHVSPLCRPKHKRDPVGCFVSHIVCMTHSTDPKSLLGAALNPIMTVPKICYVIFKKLE